MTVRSRIVMGVVLAVALVLLVYAFTMSRDESKPIVRDSAIVAAFPRPGARTLKQTTVYVELAIPYEGKLSLEGRQVEAKVIQTGNAHRLYYDEPDMRAGSHRVSVVYWLPTDPSDTRTYSWTFETS
jgi:hypothetical protein